MWDWQEVAVRHPKLRRAALAALAGSLLLFVALIEGPDSSGYDIAILVVAAVVGALGAAGAARADAAILHSFPERARGWARVATTAGALIGTVSAFVLARSGSVGIVALLAAFLFGFLLPATFLYPLDKEESAERRAPT